MPNNTPINGLPVFKNVETKNRNNTSHCTPNISQLRTSGYQQPTSIQQTNNKNQRYIS